MPRLATVMMIVVATPIMLIAVLALSLALVLENPESYRDQITNSVKSSTGYDLTIDGQLSWRYWPPIALDLHDVAIQMAGDDSPLVSLEQISIDLDLRPLLTGGQTINVQHLSLRGLMLRPVVNKDGHANWAKTVDTPATRTAPIALERSTRGEDSSPLFTLNIDGIELTDVTLDYLNEVTGEHYILEIPSLVTGPVQAGKPLTLEIEAQAHDVANEIHLTASIRGELVFDENLRRLTLTDLNLSSRIHLPDMDPVVIAVTLNGELDIEKNNFRVQLNGTLDESTIIGSLELHDAETTKLTFDLTIDAINISRYLISAGTVKAPPPASDRSTNASIGTTHQQEDGMLIPAERLATYDVQGSLRVDRLDYDTYTFSDLDLKLHNSNGKFQVEATLNGYGGNAMVKVETFWKNEIQTTLGVELRQIDISKLTEFQWITGNLNADSELTFQGTMMSDAMETLEGTNHFTIENGTLDITPVKRLATAVDALRGSQSSISGWPDKMPFEQLKGNHAFRHGTRDSQHIDFTFENIQVTGKGGFDYFTNQLQYDIAIKLSATEDSAYRVSPALANIRWPLHCEGAMDASPVDLCFPDSRSVETLVKDIAKQKLKRKGQKALDKIIEKAKLKNFLKGMFKR